MGQKQLPLLSGRSVSRPSAGLPATASLVSVPSVVETELGCSGTRRRRRGMGTTRTEALAGAGVAAPTVWLLVLELFHGRSQGRHLRLQGAYGIFQFGSHVTTKAWGNNLFFFFFFKNESGSPIIAVLYCNYHLYRNYSVNLYVIIQLPQVQWRSQFLAHVERERLLRSENCNQKRRRGAS